MYRIFYQEKEILLSSKPKLDSENMLFDSVKLDITKIINLKANKINIHFYDIEMLWQKFKDHFKIVEAAGGLVCAENEYLFIKRLGKWDLPKGKIEKNEKTVDAAAREVEEECGLENLKITNKIPFITYHIYSLKDKWILKPTYWFEMTLEAKQNLKPQKEEDITEAIWVEKKDLKEIKVNTYPNILLVLEDFL